MGECLNSFRHPNLPITQHRCSLMNLEGWLYICTVRQNEVRLQANQHVQMIGHVVCGDQFCSGWTMPVMYF